MTIRWGVRLSLGLGLAVSIAANILHARSNPVSQAIAAWPPVALLLTVELISRVPPRRKALAALRRLSTASVAGIAAWVSYWHMAGVAGRYGEGIVSAHLYPFLVDGLVVVASICLVEMGPTRPVALPEAAAELPTGVDDQPAAPDDKPEAKPAEPYSGLAAVKAYIQANPDKPATKIAEELKTNPSRIKYHRAQLRKEGLAA